METFFNIADAALTFGKAGYYLFKSANIIFKLNKYIVMGFTIWGSLKLFKEYIWRPFAAVSYFFYVQSRPLTNLLLTYGQGLVIITGPTTGLGPAYCRKLISAGFRNFLLIDEDGNELKALKEDIERYVVAIGKDLSNYSFETFEFDFDDSYTPDKFKPIEDKMNKVMSNDKRISILVNNFGKMYKGDFESMDYNQISEMINGNINAITYMTRFVLRNMKETSTKSAIINVGSATAARVKSDGRFTLN
jgi:hypothetical protein